MPYATPWPHCRQSDRQSPPHRSAYSTMSSLLQLSAMSGQVLVLLLPAADLNLTDGCLLCPSCTPQRAVDAAIRWEGGRPTPPRPPHPDWIRATHRRPCTHQLRHRHRARWPALGEDHRPDRACSPGAFPCTGGGAASRYCGCDLRVWARSSPAGLTITPQTGGVADHSLTPAAGQSKNLTVTLETEWSEVVFALRVDGNLTVAGAKSTLLSLQLSAPFKTGGRVWLDDLSLRCAGGTTATPCPPHNGTVPLVR
jgi:hypothetical protein